MLLAASAFTSALTGQETTGTLAGRVMSKAGTPLAGAQVRISSPAMLGERTVLTDSKGAYRIPLLPNGTYTETVALASYATSRNTLRILAGQTARQDFILLPLSEVEKVQSAVVVVESIGIIQDKTDTVTQTNFSFEELQKVRPSDIFAAAYMAPGLDTTSQNGGVNSPSIRGGSNVGTKVLLNGAQVNDGGFSNWGSFDPTIPDMIESMAVIQSPMNAKYGGTDSGIISMVTTRGSNEFSGTLRRTYYRDFWNGKTGYNTDDNSGSYSVNQPNRLGVVNNPYQAPEGMARGQWQATLKGPIWKDHITFAYATKITPETNSPKTFHDNTGSPNDTTYTAYAVPGTGKVITQGYYGDFEGQTLPSSSKRNWNQYVLFAQITDNHSVDFSYTQEDTRQTNFRSNTAGGIGDDKTFNTALSIGYKGILSAAGVLDARYGRTKRSWSYEKSDLPAIKSMTGTLYPNGSGGWRTASNLLELWENTTPFNGVSGSPTDSGDGQIDTTADVNYQHIIQTAQGSHMIDVGATYHKFEWDTPSPTGYAQNQFRNGGEISKTYSDPAMAGKFIVFPWNASVNDVAPGYWSDTAAASSALMANTNDYYWLLPTLWQGQGLDHGYYDVKTTSFYINDLWTISNQHSIMVGLRDDVIKGEDATHTVISYSQITPRFEYKFDVAGDQKRVINVSYAQFHQPLNGGILQPFIQTRYAYQTTRYWTGTANPNPIAGSKAPYLVDQAAFTNPANYGYIANYTAPGVDKLDSNVKGMTDTEITVGYRRNFDNGGTLRVTLIDRNWKNLYDWFPDTKGTKFTNPYDTSATMWGLSRTLKIDPNAHRRYRGAEIEWNLPLADRLTYGGNYSFSRFTGNDNENLTSNPYNGVKGQGNISNWNALYYDQYFAQAGQKAAPDGVRRPMHHLKGWFTLDMSTPKVKQTLTLRSFFDSGAPFNPTETFSLPTSYTTPNYNGNRLPNNLMTIPVGGYNQFSYEGVAGFSLHYSMDVPIYRKLTWIFMADIGNVFQHVVTANASDIHSGDNNARHFTASNTGTVPMWSATNVSYLYANGWRANSDLSQSENKTGFRTMSLETGFRF
jgi:hypothetical protein